MRLTRRKNESTFTVTSDDLFNIMVDYIRSQYRVSGDGGGILSMEATIDDNDEVSDIVIHTDIPGKDLKRWPKL